MRKWICKVCQYVHEGDEPPERCPVCNAPREQFELWPDKESASSPSSPNKDSSAPPAQEKGGAEGVPQRLEEVRDRARERLQGICAVYPACDGLSEHICQREAYGQPIGLGGVGTGQSFEANVRSLAQIRLRMRLVGDHFEPDTSTTFLDQTLSLPVMGSSTAGLGGYRVMEEEEFCLGALQGCLDAGTLSWRGDTEGYTLEHHPALDALEKVQGRGIPIFKPRDQETLKRLIARANQIGCPAVGLDLDGCGSTNMARDGQPVFRKSVAQLRELVQEAGVPFITKGILDPDDAEACVEAGARVIAVSNHGGRVLDSTPGVAEALPAIVDRVGKHALITADGGVRTGFDVLKMLATGAHAVLLGRDLIRAVIGGGPQGVALQIKQLQKTLRRAMLLTNCPTVQHIGPHALYPHA